MWYRGGYHWLNTTIIIIIICTSPVFNTDDTGRFLFRLPLLLFCTLCFCAGNTLISEQDKNEHLSSRILNQFFTYTWNLGHLSLKIHTFELQKKEWISEWVIYATWAVAKRKPEKYAGLNSYIFPQAFFSLLLYITAMIIHLFTLIKNKIKSLLFKCQCI